MKNYFRNTIRMSEGLDPDQAQCYVGPDPGPDCCQRLSADDTSRQRVKYTCGYLYSGYLSRVIDKEYEFEDKLRTILFT